MPTMSQLREFAPTTGDDDTPTSPILRHIESIETLSWSVDDLDWGAVCWRESVTAHHALVWFPVLTRDIASTMPSAKDEYLYHSPLRPTWFTALSSISDQAGMDVEYAGHSDHTFTIRTPQPLDDHTLDSFQLEPVDEIPDHEEPYRG